MEALLGRPSDIANILNGILAGLVGITSACSVVQDLFRRRHWQILTVLIVTRMMLQSTECGQMLGRLPSRNRVRAHSGSLFNRGQAAED